LYRCNQAWGIHSIYLVRRVFFARRGCEGGEWAWPNQQLVPHPRDQHLPKAQRQWVGRVALITRKEIQHQGECMGVATTLSVSSGRPSDVGVKGVATAKKVGQISLVATGVADETTQVAQV